MRALHACKRVMRAATLQALLCLALSQDAAKLETWPPASHAEDLEDILAPGPAHVPPMLESLAPQFGPAGEPNFHRGASESAHMNFSRSFECIVFGQVVALVSQYLALLCFQIAPLAHARLATLLCRRQRELSQPTRLSAWLQPYRVCLLSPLPSLWASRLTASPQPPGSLCRCASCTMRSPPSASFSHRCPHSRAGCRSPSTGTGSEASRMTQA